MKLTASEAQKVALSVKGAEDMSIEIDRFIASKLQGVTPQVYFRVLTMVKHNIDKNLRLHFG